MRELKNNTQYTKSTFSLSAIQKREKSYKYAVVSKSPLGDLGVKASPWGRLVGLLVFMFLAVITNAQPLPPTTPSGSPVPVEGLLALLPIALAAFGIIKLRKRKEH